MLENIELEPWHGTPGGYSNRKCRCSECKKAWSKEVKRMKEQRSRRLIPEYVHGTENGYGNYKCRCDACTETWRIASLERRHRREGKL